MNVMLLTPAHCKKFKPHESQQAEWDEMQAGGWEALIGRAIGSALVDHKNRVLAIGGAFPSPQNPAILLGFMFFSNTQRVAVLRHVGNAAVTFIDTMKKLRHFHAMAIHVRTDFPQAARWAELLGFQRTKIANVCRDGRWYSTWKLSLGMIV